MCINANSYIRDITCKQPPNMHEIRVQLLQSVQLLADFVTQTPYQGSAPGPCRGTSIPRLPDSPLQTFRRL